MHLACARGDAAQSHVEDAGLVGRPAEVGEVPNDGVSDGVWDSGGCASFCSTCTVASILGSAALGTRAWIGSGVLEGTTGEVQGDSHSNTCSSSSIQPAHKPWHQPLNHSIDASQQHGLQHASACCCPSLFGKDADHPKAWLQMDSHHPCTNVPWKWLLLTNN
jgi:hypothetical protein